jgi:serine/threonine-protein kinase
VESAIAMYTRATQLDPRFALAFAQLGRTHAWLHRLGFDATEARLALAKRAVDSARVLQPNLAEAHIALALYEYWGRWNYDRAVSELMIARKMRPGMAAVYQQLGNVHRRQGRWADAISAYKQAAELDPRSHVIYYNLSETLLHVREYPEAQRYLADVIELSPDFLEAYLHEATLLIHWKGDVDGARRSIEEAIRRAPPSQWRPAHRGFWAGGLGSIIYPNANDILSRVAPGLYGLDTMSYYVVKAGVYSRSGEAAKAHAYFDSARVILEQARDDPGTSGVALAGVSGLLGVVYAGLQRPREALRSAERAVELVPISKDAFDGPDWVANLARVHVMIGDHDAALAQLTRVIGMPSRLSVNSLRLAPAWAPLREDPRFQSLIAGASSTRSAGTMQGTSGRVGPSESP